jgi:hypothetical protein
MAEVERKGLVDRPFRAVLIGVLVVVVALGVSPEREQSPTRAIVFGALLIVLLLIPALITRDIYEISFALALVPAYTASTAKAFIDPDPSWLGVLRAISYFLLITLAMTVAMKYAKGVRELDRVLFTEATSTAFFVTLAGAGAYSIAQRWLDAPALPLAAVSAFGLVAWGVIAFLLSRRYT